MFLCILLFVSSAYHLSFVSLTNIHQPSQHQKDFGGSLEEKDGRDALGSLFTH